VDPRNEEEGQKMDYETGKREAVSAERKPDLECHCSLEFSKP
jgi:hypothetical protein